MNDSLELALTIGNPSDTHVAEGLWGYCEKYDRSMATPKQVVGYLVALDLIDTVEEAFAAVDAELVLGGIQLIYGGALDGTEHVGELMAGLDSVTRLRIARRVMFWSEIHPAGIQVPPHIRDEGVIARAAVIHWQETMGEAVGVGDLVDTVQMLTGYSHRFWAIHIVLNAIDALAIYTKPEHDAHGFDWSAALGHRCWLTDGWLQPAES